MRCGRYPEADTPGHCIARVESFQFAAKQMGRETKATRVLIEYGYQIVGNHVLIGIFIEKFRILWYTIVNRVLRGMPFYSLVSNIELRLRFGLRIKFNKDFDSLRHIKDKTW